MSLAFEPPDLVEGCFGSFGSFDVFSFFGFFGFFVDFCFVFFFVSGMPSAVAY